jgi:hypothetical protein
MKNIKIDRKEYYFQIASDVVRDGIGIELWEVSNNDDIYLAEIFRNDEKKRIEFTAEVKDLPIRLIEKLMELFKSEIPQEFQE